MVKVFLDLFNSIQQWTQYNNIIIITIYVIIFMNYFLYEMLENIEISHLGIPN